MEFDRNLRALVKTCQDVVKAGRGPFSAADDSLPVKYLNRYEITFRKEALDIHKPFILELYLRFKDFIARNKTEFKWMEEESVVLILGDGTERPSNNIKVMISHFYRQALSLLKSTEKELDGQPASAYENRLELLYPEMILLYTFRLFREVCSDRDKSGLDFIVKHLENSLGVGDRDIMKSDPNPMSQVISMATKFMSQLGLQPPPDSKMPRPEDVENIFQRILTDPKTTDTMSTLFKTLGESKDLGEMISNLDTSVKSGKFNSLMSDLVKVTEEQPLIKSSNSGSSNSGTNTVVASSNSADVKVSESDDDSGEIPVE